jgi:hypothetical protein
VVYTTRGAKKAPLWNISGTVRMFWSGEKTGDVGVQMKKVGGIGTITIAQRKPPKKTNENLRTLLHSVREQPRAPPALVSAPHTPCLATPVHLFGPWQHFLATPPTSTRGIWHVPLHTARVLRNPSAKLVQPPHDTRRTYMAVSAAQPQRRRSSGS